MANDKSLNQFYEDFMEEVLVASDMETSGWAKDDFLTSIMLEYLEEAGEVAENKAFSLNEDAILEASRYDGFYAVYTSLDAKKYPVSKINEINHGRWEIEECFRIMKSEFQARPVYLQKDSRIKAHFMTCFIALLILRILEDKLGYKYTYQEIIDCLSGMKFTKLKETGYIPSYKRTNLTDDIHDVFSFRTDYEILSPAYLKKIFALSKKPTIL